MSDDKWEKMEDWEIKICKRIEELEASSASHTDKLKNRKTIEIQLQKEIAELKECMVDKDWLDAHHEQERQYQKGLTQCFTELKELKVFYFDESLYSSKNREVLRELIDVMRKHLIIDHDHESTDVLEEESELVKLLAKLSGSGGEKEVVDEQKLVMGETGTQVAPGCEFKSHPSTFTNSNATDSKPPEPIRWQYVTDPEVQPEPREDDDYDEWLRSVKETLKEGGYIPVKREDLQELYYWGDIEEDDLKYMHNLEPKELERYKNFRKRIKEEYSL